MPDEHAADVVVVGAGSAGAAIAARLAEDPDRTVLLLEAGADYTSAQTPPAIASPNLFGALMLPGQLWTGLLATRRAGQAAGLYARGRGVGGCSSVNALMGLRGIPEDYDRWATDYGCTGWSWADMLPHFLAAEDDAEFGGDGLHGKSGPIPLTRVADADCAPLDRALCAAVSALGYPSAFDYHAPGATGLSRVALTMRDGRRVSTNDGYIEPARSRANFAVRGDTLVDRVALDGTTACGVVTAAGEEIAAREVIVAAGAIHSPAILLRSGIGPESGLPVGHNLIDHAATAGFELALNERGRARSVESPACTSVLRYSSELADAGPNDMQIVWFGAVGVDEAGLAGGRVIGAAMRVFSRGHVRLASRDPSVDPAVDFEMLSDERDRVRLRDNVRRILEVIRHDAVAELCDDVRAASSPIDDLQTDRDIDEWLDANVTDYVHAVGSCRMGAPGDPAAVVDPQCRVIGYDGLRVCDASVMPDIPRANTHLTTVAIAERLATLMR